MPSYYCEKSMLSRSDNPKRRNPVLTLAGFLLKVPRDPSNSENSPPAIFPCTRSSSASVLLNAGICFACTNQHLEILSQARAIVGKATSVSPPNNTKWSGFLENGPYSAPTSYQIGLPPALGRKPHPTHTASTRSPPASPRLSFSKYSPYVYFPVRKSESSQNSIV